MARPKVPPSPPAAAACPGESLSFGSREYLFSPVEVFEAEAGPEAGPTRCEVDVGLPRLTESMCTCLGSATLSVRNSEVVPREPYPVLFLL